MKKIFTLVLAIIMVLSLVACGEDTDTVGSAPSSASKPDTSTASSSDEAVVKLYANEDTLVFELTDPSIAEFKQFTDLGEVGRIKINLGSLDVTLRKYADKEGLTVGFDNSATGNGAWSTTDQADENVVYSIENNTLLISCKAHGYDTSQLFSSPDGMLEIGILKGESPYDEGAGFLISTSIKLKDVEISKDVPTV